MATVGAIHAVCSGVAEHLSRAYQLAPAGDFTCSFEASGTSELRKLDGSKTTCSLFLYRVSHNEYTRNPLPGGRLPRRVLLVDVHFLVTAWADTAQKEHLLLAWVMRELFANPVLDRAILGASANFLDADQIQLVAEELTLDDMTKLWQALVPPYRPSITYVARNIRIDLDQAPDAAPVVAKRLTFTNEVTPS